MKLIRVLGMSAVLLCAAFLAGAYPTLTGPTGMAILPTAEMTRGGLSLAADWQEFEEGNAIPIRALIALGGNAELGAMYTPFDDTVPALDRMMGANIKVGVGEFLGGTGALGAQYLRLEDETGFEIDFPQAYFAWTTTFGGDDLDRYGFTWGANWTRVDPDLGGDEDAFRLYAGLMVALTSSVALIGEIQSADGDLGDESPISAATVRFGLGDNLSAQVGFTNALGVIGLEDHNWFAGLNLAFGGGDDY